MIPLLDLLDLIALGMHWYDNGHNASFVDVGANCGLYASIMGVIGHRILAIDPLPACISDIEWNRQRNKFETSRFRIVRTGISNEAGSFPVPEFLCSPYFQVGSRKGNTTKGGGKADQSSGSGDQRGWGSRRVGFRSETVMTPATRLADVEGLSALLPITLLKIDTQGHEVRVLQSARPLLQQSLIKNMLWELTVSQWKDANVTLSEGLRTLEEVFDTEPRRYFTFFIGTSRGACAPVSGVCGTRGEIPEGVKKRLPKMHTNAFIPVLSVSRFANTTSRGGLNLWSVAVDG